MQDRLTEIEIKIAHVEKSLNDLTNVLHRPFETAMQIDRIWSYAARRRRVHHDDGRHIDKAGWRVSWLGDKLLRVGLRDRAPGIIPAYSDAFGS
jgi:hypothetical protein